MKSKKKFSIFLGCLVSITSLVQAAPIEFNDYLKISRGGMGEGELIEMAGMPDYVSSDRVIVRRELASKVYRPSKTHHANNNRDEYVKEYIITKDMVWYADNSVPHTTTVTVRDGRVVGVERKKKM